MKLWSAVIACVAMTAFLFQEPAMSAPRTGEDDVVRLLDVPYVPQSEALCGGAALAMVLRYWGESAVFAEDFAGLLEPGSTGIRTGVLVSTVRSRGWTAFPVTGDRSVVQRHLAAGRPMIMLTGHGSGSGHYVVVVAWANGSVIAHDPAVGPNRVHSESAFDASWADGGHWALLVLPPGGLPLPDAVNGLTDDLAPGGREDPCSAMVDEGVRQALDGDVDGAEITLRMAEALYPNSAAPLRELAGLRFNADDWKGATRLAERALALDPGDSDTWRLLAGSRFLLGDIDGSLDAWNHLSEPRNDLTHIDGLVRTRYQAVADQIDLPPRQMITSSDFRRARRRLDDVPASSESRLGMRPLPGGAAQVNVAVLERPLLFDGPLDAGGVALESLVDRELSVDVASPFGRGELWTVQYRWWRERPKFLLALAIPAAHGRPGIWRVEGLWEQQAYAPNGAPLPGPEPGRSIHREERRRTSLSFADWIGPDLRLESSAALDTWVDRGSFGSLGVTLEARSASDRLSMITEAAAWVCTANSLPFQFGSVSILWRPGEFSRGGWLAHAGMRKASLHAPLDLWPGAGTGHARTPLLRAHPLLDGGILNGRVFGRTLVHGGLERQSWPWILGPVRLGLAAFLDGAKPWDTLSTEGVPWQVDGGVGLRLAGMGRRGQLRIDIARGFTDGESAVSVGWEVQ